MSKLKDFLILLCCIQAIVAVEKGPLTSKTFDIEEGIGEISVYQFEKSNSRSVRFLLEGETDDIIEIDPNNGLLRILQSLKWDKRNVHTLQVKTVDSGGLIVEGPYTLTIIVEDINNNPPVFNQSVYHGEVREQSRPGLTFIQVFATDNDDPSTPNAQLIYKIKQQIPDPIKVMFFKINNATGEISTTINGSQFMKFGDKPYELVLEVADLSERPFSHNAKVYISILENLWKAPKPISITENSTDVHPYSITKVTWNDPNVIYELHQREKFPRFPFTIDNNGNINVTEALDREEQEQYIFYALAKNFNGVAVARPLEIQVKVEDINDNPPICPGAMATFEVQENEAIGSVIGVLEATDKDQDGSSNSVLTYTILEQWPKTSPDMFRMSLYDGDIQLSNSGVNTHRQYRVKVQVSDEGTPSLSTMCWAVINVIDINDHIPIFETSDYGNVTLREDTPLTTVVKEIQATDDDQPNTGSSSIHYLIVEGDPDKMFTIVTNRLNNRGSVKVAAQLDYELYREHELVIEARNPEPLTGTSYNSSSTTRLKVIVTDVDEKPVFGSPIYQVQVSEDIPIGTWLIKINASDPEGDEILFELRGNHFNWLRIDKETGDIYSSATLDRERADEYRVEVVATESKNSKMSSAVSLYLYLDDVNDNSPRLAKDYFGDFFFCHPLKKPESFEFSGTDYDRPPWGVALKFRLGGNQTTAQDWNIQYVNATSARLTMLHTNFPKKTITVPVIIRDNGRPALESEVSVPVRICSCTSDNQCENEPLDSESSTSLGLALGILFGTLAVIGIIVASVFISMNMKKKKNKASSGNAATPAETVNLSP